jgi:hypothetical protein
MSQPTPRTEHVIDQCVTRQPMTTAISVKAYAMAELLITPDVRDHLARLIDHAYTVEQEIATWRQLPPREHYTVADCHKAIRWHVGKLREHHDHITAVVARMEELNKTLPDVGGA